MLEVAAGKAGSRVATLPTGPRATAAPQALAARPRPLLRSSPRRWRRTHRFDRPRRGVYCAAPTPVQRLADELQAQEGGGAASDRCDCLLHSLVRQRPLCVPASPGPSARPPCRRDPDQGARFSRQGGAVHVRPKPSVRASGNETKGAVHRVVGDRDEARDGERPNVELVIQFRRSDEQTERPAWFSWRGVLPRSTRSSGRQRRRMVVAARRIRANQRAPRPFAPGRSSGS